jgi:hypothetical protein
MRKTTITKLISSGNGRKALGLCFAIVTLSSCQKAANPEIKGHSANTSRVIVNAEAQKIESDVTTFGQYANDFAANNTLNQGDLPSTFDADSAIQLVENTFNYFFARRTGTMTSSVTDSLTVTMQASHGQISITELAHAFNDARSTMHDSFVALGSISDKQLALVDAEFEQLNSGDVLLKIAYTFEWNDDPSTLSYVGTGSFGSTEAWHMSNAGGKQGTTAYDNILGAPEVLDYKVDYAINGTSPWYSNWLPTNVQNIFTSPYINSGLGSSVSTNANPWAAVQSGVGDYRKVFYYSGLYNNGAPNGGYIPALGLNYYLTEQVAMVNGILSSTSKSLIKYKTTKNAVIGGGFTYLTVFHQVNMTVCNIAVLSLPTVSPI